MRNYIQISTDTYIYLQFNTYKKYAKLYKDESGQTLFDKHRNWYGRGIPKVRDLGKIPLEEILEGKHPTYPRWKLRERLVKAGYLEGACQNCGYCETRITDGRSPLLLEFTDEDTNNLTVENLYELCYNCHFQIIGGLNQKKSNKLHGI